MQKHFAYFLFFFLPVGCFDGYAQTPPGWTWVKGAGDTGWDVANSVCTNTFNEYVVGYFTSPSFVLGTTTLTNTNSRGGVHDGDIFIAKYDTLGNILWAKSAGGFSLDEAYSVCTDALGNAYVAGLFESSAIVFGTTTLTNASGVGGSNVFLAKYDASGNVIWAKNVGETGWDYTNSLCSDALGNVYLAGYFYSAAFTVGTITLTNTDTGGNSADMFLVKYDSSGNVLWAKSAGGKKGDDIAKSICTDTFGNVYLTGYYTSPAVLFSASDSLINLIGFPDQAIFLAKYNANGKFRWAKSASGPSSDEASSVCTDAVGNVYMAGSFYSPYLNFGATFISNFNYRDSFLAKYDTSGQVLWVKGVGGILLDYATSVCRDASGNNVYLIGWFTSPTLIFGTTILTNSAGGGGSDIFLAKYNKSGQVLWAKGASGKNSEFVNSIGMDTLGDIYVAGHFSSPSVRFDTDTITINPLSVGWDMFLAKLSSCRNSTSSTLILSACKNYTLQGQTYTHSGVYTQTIVNSAGCDSIITLNLTINTVDTTVTRSGNALTAKQSGAVYQWIDCSTGNIIDATQQSYTPGASGRYKVVITLNGCADTSDCRAVTCSHSNTAMSASACRQYTYLGKTFTESGVYRNITPNPPDCYDTLVINLTIYKVDTVVIQSRDTLTARKSDATYQWIDCSTGILMNGSQQSIVPNVKGSYKVVISKNGCADTSRCFSVTGSEVIRLENCGLDGAKLFPNPANSEFRLHNSELITGIDVCDMLGKRVYETLPTFSAGVFNVSGLAKGMYLLHLKNNECISVRKLVVE